jgi:hypothetical protein
MLENVIVYILGKSKTAYTRVFMDLITDISYYVMGNCSSLNLVCLLLDGDDMLLQLGLVLDPSLCLKKSQFLRVRRVELIVERELGVGGCCHSA